VERSNRFREDSDLPRQFKRVDDDDYRESGYDRGHLCNSEDRTASEYLNEETFLMSNMIPQTPELNRGPFKFLEAYCRKLVLKKGQKLLIYSGGIGAKGRLTSGVPIPQYCWKAVYTPTEEIYVLFPNERTLEKNWNKYRVTKDRLEKMTGYQFP
jgi:endonuclease G